MKRKIGFAVAGLLAACGAFLVFLYLRDSQSAQETAAPEPVPAAEAEEEPVGEDGAPADPADPDAPAAPGDLAFVDADPVEFPEEFLTVTFQTSAERALGGRIRPGDTVAVVVSFTPDLPEFGGELARTTDVLLHKALVVDVQVEDTFTASTVTAPASSPVKEGSLSGLIASNYFVTLALPASHVERLVYALEYGEIWLAYQPAEAGENSNGVMSQEGIHQEASIFIDRDQISDLDDPAPEDLSLTEETADDPEG